MNCKEKEFPLRKPPEVPCVSLPLWPEIMPLLDYYEQKFSNPASTLRAGPAHLAPDADSSCCPAGSARPLELCPAGVLGTWGVLFPGEMVHLCRAKDSFFTMGKGRSH